MKYEQWLTTADIKALVIGLVITALLGAFAATYSLGYRHSHQMWEESIKTQLKK